MGMATTQTELLAIARKGRPNVRYAASADGDAIGAWDEHRQRFVIVAGLSIDGKWYSMAYEILVDGKHTVKEWRE